ncbi:tetratricopeptide repeat protein [Candidatus Magnetaquicoccus inordinatus]|uniref:tetratricopeptide repeat protein n=1 Tax=Candidatus Magnetaquicoccus inordinatus TaxID=2496818 RepID=UPI00102BED0C|nr:tetratricopeptide repeat protein [Candidatus Magnetaquicoccus inordinatus]
MAKTTHSPLRESSKKVMDRQGLQAIVQRVVELHAEGSVAQALALVNQTITAMPPDADLYNLAAVCHLRLGNAEQAEASYRQALTVRADHAETHFHLGSLLRELKREEEAESCYRQALQCRPGHAGAQAELQLLLDNRSKAQEEALREEERRRESAKRLPVPAGLLRKSRPYLIVTPWYRHSSAGIVALHYLCHELNQLGYEAYLFVWMQPRLPAGMRPLHPHWNTPVITVPLEENPLWQRIKDRVIVIYPEIISGNPVHAERVVRYMLNRESAAQTTRMGTDDYIVSFSKMFTMSHFVLYMPVSLDLAIFHDRDLEQERVQDMCWIGKGSLYGVQEKPPEGCVPITITWPATRQELGDQLRKSRFLYTYDALTSLTVEAALCGAVPVIKHFGPWSRRDFEFSELGIDGVAMADTPEEIERAVLSRPGLLERVQRVIAEIPQKILSFAQATQHFFQYR